MVAGYARDLERDDPETEIAKEITRALYKIKLPPETQSEVNEILVPFQGQTQKGQEQKAVDYALLAANYVAYPRLVDILIAHAREEEEMALIMAMLTADI